MIEEALSNEIAKEISMNQDEIAKAKEIEKETDDFTELDKALGGFESSCR